MNEGLTDRQKRVANGTLKKLHLPAGVTSLECRSLRDGTLDVSLENGEVYDRNGNRRTLQTDEDGYLGFTLNREKKHRRGKPEMEGNRKRYRDRRWVLVHRLVKMKALAVAIGGNHWREYVQDLPRGVDVNHDNRIRHDNRANNLVLQTESVNRGKREPTEQERVDVRDFLET